MNDQLDIFFHTVKPTNIPLAEKARPTELEDILGQDRLLSENSALRAMIESGIFSSFIMWGPPG